MNVGLHLFQTHQPTHQPQTHRRNQYLFIVADFSIVLKIKKRIFFGL